MSYKNRPRRTKKDKNQNEIIKAFRSHHNKPLPVLVTDIADLGGTELDLLVRVGSLTFEVEVKNPETRWMYTEGEVERLRNDVGICVTIETVEDVDKIFEVIHGVLDETFGDYELERFDIWLKDACGIHQDRIPKSIRNDT